MRPKIIPGWDTGMDIARNSSLFWHNIWSGCEKPDSGIVYNIMKTNRNTYHYKLRKLKRLKQSKIKDSISRCMIRSKNRNYWRSARAVRKNNYNSTLTVDGIHGTSEIANHFKTTFSGLYSSVPTSEETVDAIAENIDVDIQKYCSSKVNRDENYVHCHVISRDDVRNAVSKLKSRKIDEDG